jgi:hypothetical protein
VYLSRVTWLVLGTTLVLVSAVLVAAVVFINGNGQTFPAGGQAGPGGGVVRVQSAQAGERGRNGGGRAQLAASRSAGGRQVAAHPATAGLAASLGAPPGSGGPTPGSPPADQYSGSLQQLKAALGSP